MQEGTISGNAACESLDLSKQICLELTKKKRGRGGGRHGKEEEDNSVQGEVALRPPRVSGERLDSWHRASRENLR